MGYIWRLFEWVGLLLSIAIAAFVATFLFTRRRIMRHVEEERGRNALLMAAGARVGESGNGKDVRSSLSAGILMLLSSGLYFHAWLGSREVFVPGPSISWIGVSDARDAPRAERHRIVVRFLNAAGKEDGISIRLLYPTQWVAAIKTHLITRAG
jgi:heme exporter protein D